MPKSILAYIIKHSTRQQLLVLFGTLFYMPLLYLSFELPKIILNQAIGGKPSDFPRVILGLSFDQFSYLLTLCAVLFVLVLGAGAFT